MPSVIGKTLGKVQIDMFLAKGGMADVYIGTHTSLHRSVAVKFLKTDLQEDSSLRERFEREARVIAMLRHPNIVQIFDFDSHDGQPYLVMEYVPGTSLGSYLRELHKRLERLTLPQVLSLLKKMASALSYAHDNNVVHRDVKPANILLTSRSMPITDDSSLPSDTEPILTDFGLVRFTKSNKQTSTGVITGTPAYMSPEQARGANVDARTDVYSLGVTVYEMLAGKVPFDSDSTLGVLHQVVNEPPPPIDGISKRLQSVMDRALAKDPNHRFASALEFAEAFEEVVIQSTNSNTGVLRSVLSKSPTITRKSEDNLALPAKRRNFTPLIIGILGLVVAYAAFTFATMPKETPAAEAHSTDHSADTGTPLPGSIEPVEVESVGLLRFQDGSAKADKVTFSSSNLPLPAEGTQYEAWLVEDNGETRFSIGVIQFDANNNASLSFVDGQGRNLIKFYHGLELTIEPVDDNNPNPSNVIAFRTMIPPSGFSHVRHLLSSFVGAPDQIGLLFGLTNETELLNALAASMLAAFEAGDERLVKVQAEQMLNIIVGSQSDQYRDWNADGNLDDPSDGFGMLLNGSNNGYIQAVFAHANLSTSSPDATENMLLHGEHVLISITNVSEWTPQLRDELIAVINAESLQDAEQSIRQAIVLADEIQNGLDANGNENIEPIPGEGGALTAYGHAYYMADIELLP